MTILVLLRHGETVWGQENRFAGWGDTPLSETGYAEARRAGKLMRDHGCVFDVALCSRLIRARQTLEAVIETAGLAAIPVTADWRLNERHYGGLQGMTRAEAIENHGNRNVVQWRRKFHALPPPLEPGDPRWQEQAERFADIPQASFPASESMAMAALRASAAWGDAIAPQLAAGKRLLVVAHTSSIRALVREIEGLDDRQAEEFRIATAIPRVYTFDGSLGVIDRVDMVSGVRERARFWANRLKPGGLGWI